MYESSVFVHQLFFENSKLSTIDHTTNIINSYPSVSAEQSVLLSTVPGTSMKQAAAVTMADIFVPSPGLYGVTSPNSSIYDMDRSDQTFTCCVPTSFSNPNDSIFSDEIGLDDKIEDSNIQSFLTPDVMNSLQSVPEMNNGLDFWTVKEENEIPISETLDTLDGNPTLTQLNMEPEISFVNDILNVEQDDSKFNYSLDFLCSDLNSLNGQCNVNDMSLSSAESSPNFTNFSSRLTSLDSVRFHNLEQKPLNSVQLNIKSACDTKNSFHPQARNQQIIGIVLPTKKSSQEDSTPSLHQLLTKQNQMKSEPTKQIHMKSDPSHPSEPIGYNDNKAAQIVPNANSLKRNSRCLVKEEPLSPQSITLVKDESTDEKWKDIEKFLHSPEQDTPVKKRRRYDSGSSSYISDEDDEDEDDNDDDDDDKDNYRSDDYDSDIDPDVAKICPKDCESLVTTGKKQKQFFWQYNVQSKGPKGTRLKLAVEAPADPHVLNDFEDPVFDECNTSIAGIRHGGKARKGDGNEITPNPKKLFVIGHQLMKLNRQITACQLGSDVPTAKRNESRKEKNKLASRACRLKKKAQHEANKIKLYGLEQEHGQLNSVVHFIWPLIKERAKHILEQNKLFPVTSPSQSLTTLLESEITHKIKDRIAGNTTDFVNSVILKVESGDQNGGLNIRKKS